MRISHSFSFRSVLPYSAKEIFIWHCNPSSLERSLFFSILKIGKKPSSYEGKDSSIALEVHFFGPFWFSLLATGKAKVKKKEVILQQEKGPFFRGVYRCVVRDLGSSRAELSEEIHCMYRGISFLNSLYKKAIERRLSRLLAYKSDIIKRDLMLKRTYRSAKPLRILVSGAQGFIGSHLCSFLSFLKQDVWKLTRASRPTFHKEIIWNIDQKKADLASLENFDVMIHLAGENIGKGRWTKSRKKQFFYSRIAGTQFLVSLFKKLKNPPKTLLTASAVGFYGDCGTQWVDEESPVGKGSFLSDLAISWENAALVARELGIRTLCARFGMVLSRDGGAFPQLLLPFKWGIGGRIGDGKQYISWITIDDLVGALYHILHTPSLEGAINCVTPYPETQNRFAQCLAKALHRKKGPPLPKTAISLFFGQKGRELLLQSTRVYPKRLLESGYHFQYDDIHKAFSHII